MFVDIGYFRQSFEIFTKILLIGIRQLIRYRTQGEEKKVV